MAVPHNGGVPGSIPPGDGVVDDLTAATLTVTGASTLAAVTATTATITTLNTTLAGELGGTPAAATVDALHSGSTHAATQAAAEATAADALTAHEADTTAVHGIADTTVLATDAEVTAAVAAHEADTTSVHGIVDTTVLATDAEVTAAVSAHTGDASAAHAASAVSILDEANDFAATDVEGALAELQSDAELQSNHIVPWALVPYYGAANVANLVIGAANRAVYVPVTLPAPATINGVHYVVGNSVGNISVALYSTGLSRLATSGDVACPAAGRASTNFTSPYTAAAGRYYLCLTASDNTATFGMSVGSGIVGIGVKYQETAHPAPATAVFAGDSSTMPAIVGIINGGYPT